MKLLTNEEFLLKLNELKASGASNESFRMVFKILAANGKANSENCENHGRQLYIRLKLNKHSYATRVNLDSASKYKQELCDTLVNISAH